MTLEEMLKGIDDFFDAYTPESFCKMLEDDFGVVLKDVSPEKENSYAEDMEKKMNEYFGNFYPVLFGEMFGKKYILDQFIESEKGMLSKTVKASVLPCGEKGTVFSNNEKYEAVA